MKVKITSSGLMLVRDLSERLTRLSDRHNSAKHVDEFYELKPAKSSFIPQTKQSPKLRVLKEYGKHKDKRVY